MGLFMTPPTPAEPDTLPCATCPNVTGCKVLGKCFKALANAPAPEPDTPPPPTWEVYAKVEGPATPTRYRVMYKGVELDNITTANIDVTERGAVLSLTVELPADSFVQLKGAKYDWRSTHGREPKG